MRNLISFWTSFCRSGGKFAIRKEPFLRSPYPSPSRKPAFFAFSFKFAISVSPFIATAITVMAVAMKRDTDMATLKEKAKKAGFLLGEGYGDLKKGSFRIANFPPLRQKEVQKLMRFLIRQF